MRMNIAMNRPRPAREFALVQRQLVDQDRDEDDVVDAQHQLQRGQGGEGDPDLGIGEQFDHSSSSISRNTMARV
jgi:hypothetical protein